MRPREFRFLALIGLVFLTPARAQNIHINSTQGSVAVLRGDADQPVQRSLQATLVTGDRIVTGGKSQAEVQIDAANVLHVGPGAEVRLAEVYPGRYQMVLGTGGVTWRVSDGSTADGDVETPSVSVRPREPGQYAIAINDKGETEIVARTGHVEVFAPTGSQWLAAGQKMLARGPASDPEFQMVSRFSKWRKFLAILSNFQVGDIVTSFASNDGGGNSKPRGQTVNPVHSGNTRVSPPESGHSPAGSGHGHTAPPQHTAPASAAHSSPAAAPAAPSTSHSAAAAASRAK
jgi:hypothetical protein